MRFPCVIFFVGLCVLSSLLRAGDAVSGSTIPRPETEEEWEAALAPYIARAQRAFPAILQRLESAEDGDTPTKLIIVTRRRGPDGKFIEILMDFDRATSTGLLMGTVMGKQHKDSPVQEGAEIGIVASEIYDWGFREGRKSVEGFITKKARTAILAGVTIVNFNLQADRKGRLIHVELDSAVLPLTRDEVTDILPAHVVEDGKQYLFDYYKTNAVPERFAQVTLFYTFPGGQRLEGPDGEAGK